MKLNQIIAGCALAAGLMAYAPQAQAGLVYDNSLFMPLNVKVTFTLTDYGGKTVKVGGTSKDVLRVLGYPSGTTLAYLNNGDVYAINLTDGIFDDLSADGYIYVDLYLGSSQTTLGKKGAYKYSESGTISLRYFSDVNFRDISYNNVGFITEGSYKLNKSQSSVNPKTNTYKVSESFQSSDLSGQVFDANFSGSIWSIYGIASGKGSGTLMYR